MDKTPSPAPRRLQLLAGGLTFVVLTLAFLTGAGLPPLNRATPLVKATPSDPSPLPDWPEPIEGRVLDAESGIPLAGVPVQAGPAEVRSDAEGRFLIGFLEGEKTLLVKTPGYEKKTVIADRSPLTVSLHPKIVKAAYLTYFGVGDRTIRGRVFDLLGRTELNAVVIDVKGDRGMIPYRTRVPLALEAGAQGPVIIREFDRMLADLKARDVYTIARVVAFKDNALAHFRPEWAVKDTRSGRPWMDNEKLAWVDPFREEVWEYVIAIAREAAEKGFDEIQFDYLRFPTDGKLGAARYARANTKENRLEAISAFLARARRELAPTGAFLAADIFGYTAFNENDTDIGQRVEELAPHLDYLSPMVYPSGYHRGIPGFRNPIEHPYRVVFESVRLIRKRSAHASVKVRPWIQDFRDYAFDRRPFGVKEIRAQIKGATDAGAAGWMLWNPRNNYTAAALAPKIQTSARDDSGR